MIRRTLSIALVASTLLLGCQSDQDRAREILEQSRTSVGAPAREALTEATRLDPTLREAWSRLADVEGSESRWAEARAAVQRAIALSDDSAHDRETEARAAIELEDWSGAETSITRALALGSPEAPRRTQLGKVLEHLDRTDDALAAYRRAVELDAGQLEARLGVARLLVGRVRTILDAPEAPAEIAEFAHPWATGRRTAARRGQPAGSRGREPRRGSRGPRDPLARSLRCARRGRHARQLGPRRARRADRRPDR
ncbi:MAG: tetratricopeptide repeat protein [Sandaracinus sp.]